MIYTVTWQPRADDQLMEIWLRSADRAGVTAAAHRIEQELRQDADTKGQPVAKLRAYVDDPLAVIYAVSPDDCIVSIVWVQEH